MKPVLCAVILFALVLPGWSQNINSPSNLQPAAVNSIVYVSPSYPTVAAAMDALPATGGTVVIPCSATPYAGPSNAHWKTGIHVKSDCPPQPTGAANSLYGQTYPTTTTVTLQYSSSLTIGSASAELWGIGVDGITFDFQGTGGLTLESVSGSSFTHWSVVNCSFTSTCITLLGSAAGNVALNTFYYTMIEGGNIGMKWNGDSAPVTGNIFNYLTMGPGYAGTPTSYTFISIPGGADTNFIDYVLANGPCTFSGPNCTYSGIVYILDLNSDNTAYHGVYDNKFGRWDFNNVFSSNASSKFIRMGQTTGDYIEIGLPPANVSTGSPPVSTLWSTGYYNLPGQPTISRQSSCTGNPCSFNVDTTFYGGGTTSRGRFLPNAGYFWNGQDANSSISSGWGTGATWSIQGYDTSFKLVINAGSSGFSGNPSFTMTFQDGPFPSTGVFACSWANDPAGLYKSLVTVSSSTQLQVIVNDVPQSGTYYINCVGSGY